jgi:2-oxoglutarate dehydrogenase E2 component (dihydrolipoamide succinyltransferase)
MSDEIKVLLPKLGESIHSATVVQWFKKIGDSVGLDEPLLEVSTDKVNSEIPSPAAGLLKEIHANPDQEMQVGELIAVISVSAVAAEGARAEKVAAQAPQAANAAQTQEMKDFFSPALLRIAREKGVGFDELEKISGTGAGGRLTKQDLESYLEKRPTMSKPCPIAAKQVVASGSEEIERLKMTGMRKAIADNMVRSFYEAPHATLVTEVDVTSILKLIQKEKENFLAKHGFKLTITAFIARAMNKALQEYLLWKGILFCSNAMSI